METVSEMEKNHENALQSGREEIRGINGRKEKRVARPERDEPHLVRDGIMITMD